MPDTAMLQKKNPETTALIKQRQTHAQEEGKKYIVQQYWVPFSTIPELLKKTVRISEDASFYFHKGIDLVELKESLIKNWEKKEFARGGSTITQQLAKNLYLSTDKTIIRKIKEYFIAKRIEKELSKNRIFHLYLNIIELGPGIFGVEAASRYYFSKSVSELNLEEIIRLTAIIPQPLRRGANQNSRWLNWRCRWILDKLKLYNYIDESTSDSLLSFFE
jgi:monofunctional biosynthetic peptidoglycan transglycosylase